MKVVVRLLLAVVLLGIAWSFSTCRREQSGGGIELTLFDWTYPPYIKINRQRIAIFEKENPGIRVKMVTGDTAKYLTMVTGDVAPDVAYEPYQYVPYYAKRGILLPLDEFIAEDEKKRQAILALDKITDAGARRKAILALDESVAADAIRRKAISALDEATAADKEFSCAEYFGTKSKAVSALDRIADVDTRRRAIFALDESVAADAAKRKAISAIGESIAGGGKFSCAEYFNAGNYYSNDDYFRCGVESMRYRGETYALSDTGSGVALFYNRDMFDRYNEDHRDDPLGYPNKDWRWDDFRRAAKALTRDRDGDGQTDEYGASISFSANRFPIHVWQNGGEVVNKDKTRCLMDSPEAIEAIRWLYELMWVDKSAPTAYTQLEGASQQTGSIYFKEERLAMMMTTRWAYGDLFGKTKFKWDIAPLPRGKANRTSIYIGGGWLISSRTRYPRQAWRLAKFLVQDASSVMSMEAGRALPANRAVAERMLNHPGTPPKNDYVWIDIMDSSRHKDFEFREMGNHYIRARNELDYISQGRRKPEEACRNFSRIFNKGLDILWREEGGP